MNNRDIESMLEQHQREIEAIKQALAGLRISTGKTGNTHDQRRRRKDEP